MTLSQEKGLHLLYKNIGETPNETILRFKKNNPDFSDISMTYAGRLDPMAEGLLIVLSGETIKEKDKFLDLPKTYEFEILWGFETDTLDVLGRVSRFENPQISEDKVQKYVENVTGKFEQKYPAYSSKPISGKPLFHWAREGRLSQIEIPSHEVEIYKSSYLSRRSIKKNDLINEINYKLSLVGGDFRQTEILNKWIDVLKNSKDEESILDKISLTVSSGFYVRQFTNDIAEKFGTVATTFHIKRLKIGDYTIA